MDPLSIAASIVAFVGAAEASVEGLKKLRGFYKAPAEIDALVNEIEDLRLWITDINLSQHEATLRQDMPALCKLLDEARSQILNLDEIVASRLRPNGKNSRIEWFRNSSKIGNIRTSIREIKSNMISLLVRLGITQGYENM